MEVSNSNLDCYLSNDYINLFFLWKTFNPNKPITIAHTCYYIGYCSINGICIPAAIAKII